MVRKNIEVKNLEAIMEAIEGPGYWGVRGISKREIEYLTPGTILPNSWSHFDDEPEEELPGLSTVGISDLMYDDEIIRCIEAALTYSDCERVILVNGKAATQGFDPGEIIIEDAQFIMGVEFEEVK